MVKKRKIPYWLLLVALIPAVFLLLIGDTYARYDTTVSWNTVISPAGEQAITVKNRYVLTEKGTTLTFQLSDALATETDVAYTIERLQSDGSYAEYASPDLTFSAVDGAVTLVLHEATPPPGTYRLKATWKAEDTQPNVETQEAAEAQETEVTEQTEGTVQTATATFFINYSDAKAQEVTE